MKLSSIQNEHFIYNQQIYKTNLVDQLKDLQIDKFSNYRNT